MKRSNLCMAGVVALTLVAAPVARAQGTTPNATSTTTTTDMMDHTVTGTIVSTSGDEVVITTDAGQRMTFDKGVGFVLPSSMTVGDRVTLTYRNDTAGKYLVNNIVMATGTVAGTTSTGTTEYNQTTTSTTSDNYGNTRMPRTASPLPLAGLLGLLSLGVGAGLRVLNARRAR